MFIMSHLGYQQRHTFTFTFVTVRPPAVSSFRHTVTQISSDRICPGRHVYTLYMYSRDTKICQWSCHVCAGGLITVNFRVEDPLVPVSRFEDRNKVSSARRQRSCTSVLTRTCVPRDVRPTAAHCDPGSCLRVYLGRVESVYTYSSSSGLVQLYHALYIA
jgi:hypothetical protein